MRSQPLEVAFLFASALLLSGLFLRTRFKLLQQWYIPAAITGGLIGLAILQMGQVMAPSGALWVSELATSIAGQLHRWPGWLIAVVFAGLFLDKPGQSLTESLRGAAGRSGGRVRTA